MRATLVRRPVVMPRRDDRAGDDKHDKRHPMRTWLAAAAAGAVIEYMFDPRHRRARSQNQMSHSYQSGAGAGSEGIGLPRDSGQQMTQRHRSPAGRMMAGTGGTILYLISRRTRRRPMRWALRAAGAAMGMRAASNMPMRQMVGVGTGRQGVEIQGSISVAAAPGRVWNFVSDYANFPHFMTNVREVRYDPDSGISHWEIAGPAGMPVRFQAYETGREATRYLGWETVARERVAHTGAIHLEPQGKERTRVVVHFTYNPIVGAVGHTVAALLGANPRRMLEQDLTRLKSYVETGKVPSDAARPEEPATL